MSGNNTWKVSGLLPDGRRVTKAVIADDERLAVAEGLWRGMASVDTAYRVDPATGRPPKGSNVYHEHLEVCKSCEARPFDLCPLGATALTATLKVEGDL